MKRAIVAAALLALPLPAVPAAAQDGAAGAAGAASAAATITAADVRRRVGVIAHDSMRGRDTPSPGLDATARWLAAELGAMGLEPAGTGKGFLQEYPIRSLVLEPEASSVRTGHGRTLRFGDDLVALGLPLGEPREGPVVVVAAASAARMDGRVDGRHVVLVGAARTRGARAAATRALGEAGAASVLSVVEDDDAAWGRQAARAARPSSVVGRLDGDGPWSFLVRSGALRELLAGDEGAAAVLDGSARFAATGVTLRIAPAVRIVSAALAPNVAAVLPGSDPALRHEYVLFSAHMDHVGVGRPDARGDSIYNGADDDASGTATILEVAEAFASLETRPRRSLLFVWVSGEEKGLWGSRYYAEHPTVPLEDVVAGLNADMVGRNWTDTIVAIGKEHSDLGETLARVEAAHPELGMTAIDDLWPEQSFYTRSDHYNFARKGVPILFFFNGTHEDYHRPSDEPAAIDAEKTARIGRLLFWLGLEIAEADERPRWEPASRARIVEGNDG